MRRGLPHRELVFLEKWYEDYMFAKYGPPRKKDLSEDEQALAGAPWGAETIVGGST
jgi:hypothetical protein